MKIIERKYIGIAGFHDVPPGITKVSMCELKTDKDKIVLKHSNDIPTEFNEIQISGDKKLRVDCLPKDKRANSGILFLDDPDYDKKFLIRSFICSKKLPMNVSFDFIRAWVAMAIGDEQWLDVGTLTPHPIPPNKITDNEWGYVDDLEVKKELIKSIENMPTDIFNELQQVQGNPQFIADYLVWRDSLPKGERIKYKEVLS